MSNAYTLRRNDSRKDDAALGRILAGGVIVIAAGLVVYLLVQLVLLPMTTIRRVTVESDVGLSQADIQKLLGLTGQERYFTLDTAPIQKRLEANVLVRRARVEKVFPDQLRAYLYRREASALILAESGGRNVPILVDRDGFVFKVGGTAADLDAPVVSGMPAGEAALGSRLPDAYLQLFADLAALRAKSPSLYRLISEVRIVGGSPTLPAAADGQGDPSTPAAATSSAAGSVELRLFLVSSPVPVRVRGAIDETLVKYVLMVLDLLSNQGVLGDIGELDFRGGDVVYRMKEG